MLPDLAPEWTNRLVDVAGHWLAASTRSLYLSKAEKGSFVAAPADTQSYDAFVGGQDVRWPADLWVLLGMLGAIAVGHVLCHRLVFLPLARRMIAVPEGFRKAYRKEQLQFLTASNEQVTVVSPTAAGVKDSPRSARKRRTATAATLPPSPTLTEDELEVVGEELHISEAELRRVFLASEEYRKISIKFASSLFKGCMYSMLFGIGIYALLMDNFLYAWEKQPTSSFVGEETGVPFASITRGGWFFRESYASNFEQWPNLQMRDLPVSMPAPLEPTHTQQQQLQQQQQEQQQQTTEQWLAQSPIYLHYLFALAHYLYATALILLNLDGPKQSDRLEMTTHHVITVSLIAFSWYYRVFRFGAVVLVLHDVSDPFMEAAKIMLYSGRQFWANFWFASFAFVFLVSRWLLFPVMIVLPAFSYAVSEQGVVKREHIPFWYMGLVGLSALQMLHCFWGTLIVRMVVQAVTEKSVQDDVRDLDED